MILTSSAPITSVLFLQPPVEYLFLKNASFAGPLGAMICKHHFPLSEEAKKQMQLGWMWTSNREATINSIPHNGWTDTYLSLVASNDEMKMMQMKCWTLYS